MSTLNCGIDSFAGWEELIMNETAAAPSNTEHELLLETGRFWSRYFFTSRHPHLPSALGSTSDRDGVEPTPKAPFYGLWDTVGQQRGA